MLMNGIDLLAVANEHNFAVPAFNVSDYAMFNGIIDVGEEKQAPLIVAIHPDELRHTGTDILASILRRSERASVPVIVHLDHGTTEQQVLTGIQAGFTSIMIDGSMLPYHENVEVTQRIVEMAHAVGLSVEGELGTIGQNDPDSHYHAAEIIYTKPEEAAAFIDATGVDSLAIAIGTSHGIYPSDKKPELKLDLLKEIKDVVQIPLVLHGGSNNPDEEIGQAVHLGINKINISSDIKVAYHMKMREILRDEKVREPNVIQPACIEAMKVTAAEKIDLFDAAGKATLY
jgi:fructose-bisphosphate aldolase, class II